MKKFLPYLLIVLAFSGMLDAAYLTYEHFQNSIPPCSASIPFSDCGKVLKSEYSVIFGIPVAVYGVFHYIVFVITLVYAVIGRRLYAQYMAIIESVIGFLCSCYFVYLQFIVLQAICPYCMVSAAVSISLFLLIQILYSTQRKSLILFLLGIVYRTLIKRILFTLDPEAVHVAITNTSQFFGQFVLFRMITSSIFGYKNSMLSQKIAKISFTNPIGLAAGFDYEARLTQILPAAGFGFQSVGTITNSAYEGNPRPRLGRLPKSKSLMVNKGYKNLGAHITASHLAKLQFITPIGISIGRTNSTKQMTQKQSVDDIIAAFKIFEKAKVKNAYYELNISCPNLYGDISFYPPKNLDALLTAVDKLQLKKPLFIKMPIEKSDKETLDMLKILAKHSPTGVIFGNLQKNRKDPALLQNEVKQFAVGNFSGKPTYKRSNELIKLTYKKYKERFIIIGCGGVFSAEDAYEKITLGASLIQLITGMIFQGPQLITDINMKLTDLMKKDGYSHISQAIGSKNK